MAKKDINSIIKSQTEEILLSLQVPGEVEVTGPEDGSYRVAIQTDEQGLLIGYHGETLSSFQLILGLVVYKLAGEWTRIIVEIGDYRARREEQLRAMAESFAARAITSGQPVYLPYLHPAERRVVHIALQERSDVESVSEGEGRNRRIIIKPKLQQ